MDEILTGYEVNQPTWFYLSFLLITAVFFKFGRIWSLRNLDLVLLLADFARPTDPSAQVTKQATAA